MNRDYGWLSTYRDLSARISGSAEAIDTIRWCVFCTQTLRESLSQCLKRTEQYFMHRPGMTLPWTSWRRLASTSSRRIPCKEKTRLIDNTNDWRCRSRVSSSWSFQWIECPLLKFFLQDLICLVVLDLDLPSIFGSFISNFQSLYHKVWNHQNVSYGNFQTFQYCHFFFCSTITLYCWHCQKLERKTGSWESYHRVQRRKSCWVTKSYLHWSCFHI